MYIRIYLGGFNNFGTSQTKHPESVQNRLQKTTTKFTTQNEQMCPKQKQQYQGISRCFGPTFLCFLVLGMWCTWFGLGLRQEAWTEKRNANGMSRKNRGKQERAKRGTGPCSVCSVYLTYYDLVDLLIVYYFYCHHS